MPGKSTIQWTDASWNPVTGCTKVDRGCKHCYAERQTEGWPMFKGKGLFAKIELHPERLDWPLHLRKPLKIFVNSMSDLFHPNVPLEFMGRVFGIIIECAPEWPGKNTHHTFQILTKHPDRMLRFMLALREAEDWVEGCFPPSNAWLGVSAHDDKSLVKRWHFLRQTPAAIRWLSLEPLLGAVPSLARILADTPRPDWVVVGGESGPCAEPSHPDHFRMVRDFCQAAGVPFFFKQWGEWVSVSEVSGPGPHYHFDDGATVRRTGKKRAGRLLDGREWNDFPKGSKP